MKHNYLFKLLLTIFPLLGSYYLSAQTCTSDTENPSVTTQDITVQLDADGNATINPADVLAPANPDGYSVDQTGTFNPINISGTGSDVSLSDDQVSGELPIGFSFDFYGNTYTNFRISSNGFIGFGGLTDHGCCIAQNIPNTSSPNNLIALAWTDLNPGTGGVVRYQTVGTAPNRVLVVEFNNVPHYGSWGMSDNPVTVQAQLYEGSNAIEIHTTSMPTDGSQHTQGVENIDGTIAVTIPGRNSSTTWSITNDLVTFEPVVTANPSDNCGIESTVLDIDSFSCSDVGSPVTVTLTIYDVNGNWVSETATVTVEDNEAPTAIAQNITVPLDESGNVNITAAQVNNNSFDNCTAAGDLTLSLDQTFFGCESVGDKGETVNASALNFDGNDYVSIPDASSLRLTGDMTIEAWFKADGFNADWVRIAGKGADVPRNYGLWYHPDGSILFQQYGDGVEVGFNQTINIGEWYHIAGVKTGNVGKLYINGELVATNTGGTNPVTSADPFTIGYAGFHTYHIGQIDEVRLWNLARTDQEIFSNYKKTLDPATEGLLAYYNMEEAAGTDLNDLTGNGYDGSLLGFTQSTVWTESTENLGPDNIVTLTVRDGSGNESTVTATVTVEDRIAPIINCPTNIEVDNDPGATNAKVYYSAPVVTDNCDIPQPTLNGFSSLGSYNGKFYYLSDNLFQAEAAYTDAASNGGNVVTINDAAENSFLNTVISTDRIIIGLTDKDTEGVFKWVNGEGLTYTNWNNGEPNDSNNNEDYAEFIPGGMWNDIPITTSRKYVLETNIAIQTAGLASGSEFPIGTTTNTFEVTDASGNKSICSFDVTVNDVEAPAGYTVSIDQNVIDENNETEVSFTFSNAEVGATYYYTFTSDNGGAEVTGSGTISTANDQITGIDVSGLEDGNVTLSVTLIDVSSNEGAAVTASVEKDTNDAPVAVCKAFTAYLGADGTVTITPEDVDDNSYDDKTGFTLSIDKDTFDCSNIGTPVIVTLTITDSDGVTDTCTATVTVEDNLVPIVSTQNITVPLDANGMVVVTADQIDSGSTDNCGINLFELEQIIFAEVQEFESLSINLPPGKLVESVEFASYGLPTGSDGVYSIGDCHASDSKSIVEGYALGKNSFTIPADNSVFGDPCHNIVKRLYVAVSYFDSEKTFTCNNIGENPVILRVTDENGNTATKTATVTVEDIESPVLNAEANQDVILDDACSITVPNLVDGSSATDNCAFTITQSPAAGTVVPSEHNGTVAVVVTATDAAGNKHESTVVLTAKDNQAPELTAEADQDVVLDTDCSITVPNLVDGSEATDNCTVTITQSPVAGTVVSSEHNGTVDVVVTTTDAAGNKDESTVVLTAKDIEAPVLTAEAGQDVNLDEFCSITIPDVMGAATDNCTVSITQSPAVGTVIPSEHNGTVEVVVIATDAAGNKDESTVVLTAKDNVAPLLTAEADQDVNLDEFCSITVPDVMGTATDNCTATITQSPAVGTVISSEHNGTVDVLVTATDAAGNKDETTVVLMAKDITAPTPVMETLTPITAECIVEAADVVKPLAVDNCNESIEGVADLYFPVTRGGSTMITWKYDDGNGNVTFQQQEIIIEDTSAPVPDVAELEDIVVECGVADITAPTATDNCRGSITGTTPDALSYSDQGEYTITWSFDDENGNITTQQQNVIVRDVTAPEVLTRDITVYLDPETNVTIIPEDVDNGTSDNCSEVSLSLDQSYFDEVGTYEVTLTATDEAGNTSQAGATVTVEIDGIDSKEVHVVPTILKQSSIAKVVVPFRSKIMKVEILESETQRYKTFEGNGQHEMEIEIAPFKGTLLVRVIDEDGTVHLKKLIAL